MFVTSQTPQGPQTSVGTCTCCARLDRDYRAKPVTWCALCRAWLCDGCIHNWARRIRAALA